MKIALALCGLMVGFLLAAPAHALSIRVDWTADAVPSGFHPLGTIHVRGSFGVFEVATFPSLVSLALPFSARAPGFGPGYVDDVYTFESATNLGFEFTGGNPGLRGIGGEGRAIARKIVCSPPGGYCEAGEAWSLELNAPANGGPASLVLTDSAIQSGYAYYWRGPVNYGFTVVPEPATFGFVLAGLFGLKARRFL
jgi:hypothetical protein